MIVKPNFIYPEIQPDHYVFGADNAGEIIRENGDWRDYLPPEEEQKINGVESSACYIEAQQHSVATILEEEFNLADQNYSSRFNALLSGGTEYGGDPLRGADSIHNDGLIPQEMMDFKDLFSWDEFHSWKGVSEKLCRLAGLAFNKRWLVNYFIVFRREDSIEAKSVRLREALKRSPVDISVYAWVEKDGVYVKPQGVNDNHLVECVYLDEDNRAYIRDTYPPFLKILEPNYNSDFAMRHTVKKKPEVANRSIIDLIKQIWFSLKNLLGF
jgi:hypothetical protein